MSTVKLPIECVETRKKYILFKNDCGVSDHARWGSVYESYTYDYIKKHIHTTNTNIIDIGANFGFHTLEFADLVGNGKVFSFEPQLLVYYQLCGNIILNGLSNVVAKNIGLGDTATTLKMQNPNYFSESKINIGDSHLDCIIEENFNEVDVRTLDSFNIENVSVIKIDVQGFEPKVLDGAKETIEKNKPHIFIEIEPPQLALYGYTPEDIFNRLDNMNYTFEKTMDSPHLFDYVAFPK
jgi:FkbM family methyltransferase